MNIAAHPVWAPLVSTGQLQPPGVYFHCGHISSDVNEAISAFPLLCDQVLSRRLEEVKAFCELLHLYESAGESRNSFDHGRPGRLSGKAFVGQESGCTRKAVRSQVYCCRRQVGARPAGRGRCSCGHHVTASAVPQ